MSTQFTREDWTLFRSLNTLPQKAGVPVHRLGALVVKELVDNALDAGANVKIREEGEWIIIEDDGPGIPHDGIETLFSIHRPLTSSKIVRLPMRGALGNGLRVVMGAVYASHGEIVVETGGQDDDPVRFELVPGDDGHTTIVSQTPSTWRKGTRISLKLGRVLSVHGDLMSLSKLSTIFGPLGKHYNGKTSPWWYDGESFFEMCRAAGDTSLSQIMFLFRDIKKEEAIAMGGGVLARSIGRDQAVQLLEGLREMSKEPSPAVLGKIDDSFSDYFYARSQGVVSAGQNPSARLPFVVECFAAPRKPDDVRDEEDDEKDTVMFMVNRTVIAGNMRTYRSKPTELIISGCGLSHRFAVPKGVPVSLIVNVTTPYMQITTDGKEPNLRPYVGDITVAIKKAANKCKKEVVKAARGSLSTQKECIKRYLDEAIEKASSGGKFRFSLRQLYYAVRPYVLEAFPDKGLDYNYFGAVITEVEAAQGYDITGMYRDPRGKIYHPHTHEEIPLGTVAVENYKRPEFTFNKILYIEKGGFFPLLQDIGWPERNDCAIMTSQGFASRAARDVLDLLGEGDEEIWFFCIHDADASGTMIYQSLREATKARAARTVNVINLGLDPQEALEMGLQVETFREGTSTNKRLPVADYLGRADRDWLQTQRVELNAMTSEEFIIWLDGKMSEYIGKIVPPGPVMTAAFKAAAADQIRDQLADKILREQNFEPRAVSLVDKVDDPYCDKLGLEAIVRTGIEEEPINRWDVPLKKLAVVKAGELVKAEPKPKKEKKNG